MREVPGFKVQAPKGAFYVFPDCSAYLGKSFNGKIMANAADLSMYLLEEAHVAAVGGVAFGAPECMRFSYATSDENIVKAVDRVKAALAKLV